MQTDARNENLLSHNEIARRAYQLWEAEGRPYGSAVRHWLRAESQLKAAKSFPVSAAVPASETQVPQRSRYGLVLSARWTSQS